MADSLGDIELPEPHVFTAAVEYALAVSATDQA